MEFRFHFSVMYIHEVLTQRIIFRVIRGLQRTVRILVISNLCTYLAIIGIPVQQFGKTSLSLGGAGTHQ